MKTRKSNLTERLATIRAARAPKLVALADAIREKRAYIKTFNGNRLVTSYNDKTGWVITNNGGGYMNQQSYMVCLEDIIISDKPVMEERRVVKHSTFEFQGKTCQATTNDIERVFNW